TSQVKAGVMPVAGQDATVQAALVQRETHVWTAIVDREDLALVPEHRDAVSVAADDQASLLGKLAERAGPNHSRAFFDGHIPSSEGNLVFDRLDHAFSYPYDI